MVALKELVQNHAPQKITVLAYVNLRESRPERKCRPSDILQSHGFCKVDLVPRISLKCLAADTLLKARQDGHFKFGAKMEWDKFREGLGPLPPNLGEFIRLHAKV